MKVKGKRILITGGAGFIGSHICERLISEGADLVILDDFSTGRLENLEGIKDDVEIIEGKVENYKDVLNAIRRCSLVIHEAFPYGKSGMGLEEQYIEAGVLGIFNILKAAVKNNVEKIVNVSSVAAYGISRQLPVSEDVVVNPFLPYGVTKYAGELYCKSFSNLYGLDTVSLRYFYVFGPRYAQFDHSAIVKFLNCAIEGKDLIIYGDGSQVRDYTYIENVVEGTLLALAKQGTNGEVYNISSGQGITISQLAQRIVDIVNNDIKIRFAEEKEYIFSDEFCNIPVGLTRKKEDKWIDERQYVGDISKAIRKLGYSPKIDIEEGINRSVEWLNSIRVKQ